MTAFRLLWVLLALDIIQVRCGRREEDSKLFELSAQDIKTKKDVPMSSFRGKVLLIVNVASECGYTDKHYRELIDVQKSYDKNKFAILAFPCNQFGKQEPKNNEFIYQFITSQYNINFPLFTKIKTNGQYKHPIYRWLHKETAIEPNWNFNKFLVDQKGKVVRYAPATISPKEMESDIKTLLANQKLSGGLIHPRHQQHEEL